MNNFYTLLTTVEHTTKLESLLNAFRVGLNNWDKSKVFEAQGCKYVNYTILTNDETFRALVNEMNRI